jgi:MOSC domain-containing protein YiiM
MGTLAGMQSGVVESIYLRASKRDDAREVDRVQGVAGSGLEGDRYFRGDGDGTFYEPDKTGQDLTLIEAEAIEGLERDTGIELAPNEARRNVVTRGIALNDLVGKRFLVGETECYGQRLCEPCSHLERSTKPGVLKGLVNRGGLRADIVRGGWIAVGAPVREIAE